MISLCNWLKKISKTVLILYSWKIDIMVSNFFKRNIVPSISVFSQKNLQNVFVEQPYASKPYKIKGLA